MNPVLKISGLEFSYPGEFNLVIPSLNLDDGKIYSLSGPNGSGKTTLQKILALLIAPRKGDLEYRGRPIPGPGRELLELRRKMTLVEQNPYFFNSTVAENLAYGLKLRRCGAREIKKKISDCLGFLGMERFKDRRPDRLSAGERQKVALARGLILRPEILFLDEPTANVDRPSAGFIEEKVKEFHRNRPGLVVWATHSLEQAYRVGDAVLCLLEGRLVPGTIDNLFAGTVREEGGEPFFVFGPDLKALIPPHRPGSARMLIPPEEIIISLSPLDSSARNSLPGRVIKIEERGERVAVKADVGVPLVAIITPVSYSRLGLKLGTRIFLTFKTSAVMML